MSASTKTQDASRDLPATLSDTDWVADTASAERTIASSAALVDAENILASATGERAQELETTERLAWLLYAGVVTPCIEPGALQLFDTTGVHAMS